MLSLASLSNCNQIGSSASPTPCAPIQFGSPSIDSTLPSQGLRRGAIHEFFYHDPLDPRALASTLPAILAYNSHSTLTSHYRRSSWKTSQGLLPRIVWIGKRAWPSPPALAALSTSNASLVQSVFAHSIFVDPPNDSTTLWAIDLALRSSAVDLIIAACPNISRTTTQRLTLAAQKYNTTAFLLRAYGDRKFPSSAASRWTISPSPSNFCETPSWRLSLTKLRGGLLLQPEWIVSLAAYDFFSSSFEPISAVQITTESSDTQINQGKNTPLRYKHA